MAIKTKEFNDQISKNKKDFEAQLSKKTKEFNDQLSKNKKDFEAQLSNKTKELNELRQKNEELKAKINKMQKPVTSVQNEQIKIKIYDSKTIREFETIEEIGFGASGKVLKVALKQFFAMKIMSTENASVENLKHFIGEYEIMNLLNHPNILKALGIFFSDGEMPPAILLEYCPTNLYKAIKNKALSPVQIACAIYQIAEGMKYIHFRKIIHRDLKPSNILIATDGTIKISDFGISKLMTPEMSMTVGIGTNKYMAPEIITEEDSYDEKVDVYSFGVLVFFILNNGELPKIKTGEILRGKKAEIPSSFSEFVKNLINSCWNFKPSDRPSFKEICSLMEKNKYCLCNLTKSESAEVLNFVQNHQKQIPFYDE